MGQQQAVIPALQVESRNTEEEHHVKVENPATDKRIRSGSERLLDHLRRHSPSSDDEAHKVPKLERSRSLNTISKPVNFL